ncbi:MAG: PqqD family protein [Desulfotomaculaceae bacterium]
MDNNIYRISNSYSLFSGEFKENKYYLFNIEDGTIYRLNEVSYTMLSMFDGVNDTAKIVESLKGEYEVDTIKIENDFYRLLNKWLENNILISGGE